MANFGSVPMPSRPGPSGATRFRWPRRSSSQRGPLLALPADVLPFFAADDALFRRDGAVRVLGATGDADEGGHRRFRRAGPCECNQVRIRMRAAEGPLRPLALSSAFGREAVVDKGPNRLERVGILGTLVRPPPGHSRKAHGEPGLVPGRPLDALEGELEHELGLARCAPGRTSPGCSAERRRPPGGSPRR